MDEPATASVPIMDRIAAAPISWGVCEVPGWGYQLGQNRVLSEMRQLGVSATEFGPDGFLPQQPAEKAKVLASHGLRAVGGFVPVVLHDPASDPLPAIDDELDGYLAAGATRLILSADTGKVGYDSRPHLTDLQWETLLVNLDRIAAHALARQVVASIHPHVGTMVESFEDVSRVLAGSAIGLCVDTGHLLIGGTDPVRLVNEHVKRVVHVHLKDVRLDLVHQVQSGELTYTHAVAQGMYVPLGDGDIDIAAVITDLEHAGYAGFYVLEQDTVLAGEPEHEAGPMADVRRSLDFIRRVANR